MRIRHLRAVSALIALTILCAGCAASEPPVAESGCPPVVTPRDDVEFDEALHDDLVAMLERDMAGRLGTGEDDEGDRARTARLTEIIAEHGWPTFDLVGEDGEDAAWAIAQHSDLDPRFQNCALEHLRVAVEAGQGSPGNLAYLEDRINAGAGDPQRYGTQVACTPDGPEPSTPLIDVDGIDEVRASMGLPPYAEYLSEMAAICAAP